MTATALLTVGAEFAAFILGVTPDELETIADAGEIEELTPGRFQIDSLITYAERRNSERMRMISDGLARLSDALMGTDEEVA